MQMSLILTESDSNCKSWYLYVMEENEKLCSQPFYDHVIHVYMNLM